AVNAVAVADALRSRNSSAGSSYGTSPAPGGKRQEWGTSASSQMEMGSPVYAEPHAREPLRDRGSVRQRKMEDGWNNEFAESPAPAEYDAPSYDEPPTMQPPPSGRRREEPSRPTWDGEVSDGPGDADDGCFSPAPPVPTRRAAAPKGALSLLKKKMKPAPRTPTVADKPPARPPFETDPQTLRSYPLEEDQPAPRGAKGGFVPSGGAPLDDMPVGRGVAPQAPSDPWQNTPPPPSIPQEAADAPVALSQCGGCGRSFNARAFPIHQRACQKVFQNKRPTFNSAAARAPDDEEGAASSAAPPTMPPRTQIKPKAASARKPASKVAASPTQAPSHRPGSVQSSTSSRPPSTRASPKPAAVPAKSKMPPAAPAPAPSSDAFSGGGGGFGGGGGDFGPDAFPSNGPDEYGPPVALHQCGGCGRSFNEKALKIHQKICKKVFQDKVKPKDMTAARLPDVPDKGELIKSMQQQKKKEERDKMKGAKQQKPGGARGAMERPIESAETKKEAWKKKSEAFRAAMQASRGITKALAEGKDLKDIPPPPPTIDDSLIQCPHCLRRFNDRAAERHIPKCTSIKAKPNMLKAGGGSGGAANRAGAGGSKYTVNAPVTRKPSARR
ncbi:hypothetical protein CYMTET_49696, partial [Cymbomonas tetramitiformis]